MSDPATMDDGPWMVEFRREADGRLLLEYVAGNRTAMYEAVVYALTLLRRETCGPFHMRLQDSGDRVLEDDAAFDRLGLPRVELVGVAGGGPGWKP